MSYGHFPADSGYFPFLFLLFHSRNVMRLPSLLEMLKYMHKFNFEIVMSTNVISFRTYNSYTLPARAWLPSEPGCQVFPHAEPSLATIGFKKSQCQLVDRSNPGCILPLSSGYSGVVQPKVIICNPSSQKDQQVGQLCFEVGALKGL